MPNDPIAEQVEVRRKGRQRLVGAIVLALVAVVFVPMVLDPEPRRDRAEPVLAIPPKEGSPPLAQLPAAPPPATAEPRPAGDAMPAADAAKPAPPPGAAASEPPPAPAPTPVAPAAPGPAPVPPKAAPAATPPKGGGQPDARLVGFAVQVGAFREDDKLAQARRKVAAAKLPHYIERVDDGGLTRLRAGPFANREAAEKAAAQLKRAGFDPRVVPLP